MDRGFSRVEGLRTEEDAARDAKSADSSGLKAHAWGLRVRRSACEDPRCGGAPPPSTLVAPRRSCSTRGSSRMSAPDKIMSSAPAEDLSFTVPGPPAPETWSEDRRDAGELPGSEDRREVRGVAQVREGWDVGRQGRWCRSTQPVFVPVPRRRARRVGSGGIRASHRPGVGRYTIAIGVLGGFRRLLPPDGATSLA